MSLSSRWSLLTREQLASLQLEWQRSWETLVLRNDWQGNLTPCLHQTQVAIGCVDPGSSLQAIKDRRRTQQCLPQRDHISFTLKNCNESHKEVLGHMQDNLTLGNCCNSDIKLSLLKVHPPIPLLRKTFKLVVTWLPGDDTLCKLLITRYGPSIMGQGIQTRCQWPCMVHISNGLTSRNAAPRHRGHTCINHTGTTSSDEMLVRRLRNKNIATELKPETQTFSFWRSNTLTLVFILAPGSSVTIRTICNNKDVLAPCSHAISKIIETSIEICEQLPWGRKTLTSTGVLVQK